MSSIQDLERQLAKYRSYLSEGGSPVDMAKIQAAIRQLEREIEQLKHGQGK
jgi:cell division FtsZ-interacting protein ZapD